MKKILIVDDQPGIRIVLQEVLKNEGYEIQTAGSGLEAIELIKNEDFDALLTDMKLPGMNGVEILQHAADLNKKFVIMMMTAYGEQELVDQAKSLGAAHFFKKPFEIIEVRETINELLKDNDLK
ncbi:chemotaxis protein CheY [Kurthia sp. 3B1D]|uniref:Chemotaxis protein CheY n=2 Tax=Kurthia TaxID=1649 RepID=A0A433RU18_9BACL|nr:MULTISPECIES: response regulator [unclassified Kurthia]RUS55667.1 chemotaxis protein CheY [Kurthia sp. 3B1D]HIX43748.1 response regulator [Candidatus Kurthia intestinigallinarum]